MRMTIIGGGNIGTLMATEIAAKGHEVTIYTSKPEKWEHTVTVLDADGETWLQGSLAKVTSDLADAVTGADVIWVTMPAQMFAEIGAKMEPWIAAGQRVGVVPGSGGAEFAFRSLVKKGAILFGLQRVHSIARLEQYGRSVRMLGRKSKLELGAIPREKSAEISGLVEALFDIPCEPLDNYMCVTLTPSNPILHTARLYTLFGDYHEGVVYPENFRFYESWTDASSQMLIDCDRELQNLCQVIPLDLGSVESLRIYYESPDAAAMTRKLSGIRAFKGLTSPMLETDEGWIPDFTSRYFSTDFPFGLKIIRDLTMIYGVEAPHIRQVWDWYCTMDPDHAKTGIDLLSYSREDIERIYR